MFSACFITHEITFSMAKDRKGLVSRFQLPSLATGTVLKVDGYERVKSVASKRHQQTTKKLPFFLKGLSHEMDLTFDDMYG
jgi:hypothetical protein